MPDISLLDLDPTLQPLARKWLALCALKDVDVRITETFRDPGREDALHAQGITRATSATCDHCAMIDGNPASKAFDFACFRQGVYLKNGGDPAYALAGQIAESLGLTWGGRFSHADPDHIQL